MIDSPEIVKECMNAVYKNRTTTKYGKVHLDGEWRDD